MNESLSEFRKGNEQRAEEARERDPREYRALLDDLVTRAKGELLELARVIPEARRIIADAARKYPPSPSDPPSLKKAIGDFNCVLRVARQICENRVQEIQRRVDDIESATPGRFRFYTPKILAEEDRRLLNPLLAGSAFLKNLPHELDRLRPEIMRLVESFAGRDYMPDRAAVMSPQPESGDGEQIDKFDPRLS